MVLGIAKTIANAGKLLGETKKLKVFVNQFDDGVKVIKSFDKETGDLVKEITKLPKMSRNSRIGNYAFRRTDVKVFSEGEKIEHTMIMHADLPNNKKGHLSCLNKIDNEASTRTDLYIFDPNKNQKGLRAVKSQAVEIFENDSFVGESVSMSMYGGRFNGSVIKNMSYHDETTVICSLLKKDIAGVLSYGELNVLS